MDYIRHLLYFLFLMGCAFVIQELPNSNVLQSTLPNWPLLLVIYFSMSYQIGIAVTLAFIVGAVQDVFMGMPIGLNAFAFTLSAFFIVRSRYKHRATSVVKQGFLVMIAVLFTVLIKLIYSSIVFSPAKYYWILLSVPTSFIAWNLIHMFFSFFSQRWGEE